jgi:negative regulator of flagellin synthesis FlgM
MAPYDIPRIHGVAPLRPAGRETSTQQSAPKPQPRGAAQDGSAVKVETAGEPDLRQVPVDAERVAQIRDALQSGTYPLLPAKTADAMIAARMLLAVEV